MTQQELTEKPPHPTQAGKTRFLSSLVCSGGALLVFILLKELAFHRFVAVDEGFYLMAGKLVASGRLPYLDFFYPQMPLLPFLHGAWIAVFGESWQIARFITVLFSFGTLALLFSYLYLKVSKGVAVLALLAVLSQTLFLTWFTVAKTYPFAALPLIGAVILALLAFRTKNTPEKKSKPCLLYFFSGLCIGLAIDIRLFYVVLLPVFFLYILLNSEKKTLHLFAFLLGGFITFLPHLFFMVADFDSYWFNNVGYHLVRSHRSPEMDLKSKWNVLSIVTGLKNTHRIDGFSFPFLFWVSAISAPLLLFVRKLPPFPLALGLVLFAGYFIPNPVHVQYFSTCVPLLVFGLALLPRSKRLNLWVLAAVILVSLPSIPTGLTRITDSGKGLKGLDAETKEIFTLNALQHSSQLLRNTFQPDDVVMSQWPGFLFETELFPARGLENQFWVRMEGKLPESDIEKYHLSSVKRIKELPLQDSIAGLVIERRKFKRYVSPKNLKNGGFTEVKSPGLIPDSLRIFRKEEEGR